MDLLRLATRAAQLRSKRVRADVVQFDKILKLIHNT